MVNDAKKTNEDLKNEVPRTTGAFLKFVYVTIMTKKKYWLLPFWCLLAAVALILFLSGNGALLPAIYVAF